MKKVILLVLVFFSVSKSFCQQSPYTFPIPNKWSAEKIAFPIGFAPIIPYKGEEMLRFTPGWGDIKSGEYWSYCYLWFIKGTPKVNSDILQRYLTAYFNGLYRSNDKKKSVSDEISFTKSVISKVKTSVSDQETYEGKISTLDFLTGKPIEFFVRIHVRNYPTKDHSALLFEVSPKAYDDNVWRELDSVVKSFAYK